MAATPASSSPASSSSSSASPSGHRGNGKPQQSLGFMDNVAKRKASFIQLFVMMGIFSLSLRSLGQKYRTQDLEDQNSNLREERDSLTARMASTKSALLREADADPSGLLSSHLRRLFQNTASSDGGSS